jgi:fibronectin-binding autotransporter adhesin
MKKKQNSTILGRSIAAVSTGLLLAAGMSDVGAAVRTWDGGGDPDFNWSNPSNWDGDSTAPVAGDDLVFAGTAGLTNNNDIAVNTWFNSMNFVSGAGAFVLQGNQIRIGNNNGTKGVTNSSAVLQTIDIETKNDRNVWYDTTGASMIFTKRLWDRTWNKSGPNDLIVAQTLTGYNGQITAINQGRVVLCSTAGGPIGHGAQINSNGVLVISGPAQQFNADYRADVTMAGGSLFQVQSTNPSGLPDFAQLPMLRSSAQNAVVENGSALGPIQLQVGLGSAARVGAFDGTLRDGSGGGALGLMVRNSSTYTYYRLGGASSYTGETVVTNGNTSNTRLLINGVHTGGGNYTVIGNAGGGKSMLGGSGIINAGTVNVGLNGVISPGGTLAGANLYTREGGGSANTGTFAESTATLTITNNVYLSDATSTLDIHLGGTNAGGYDKLVVAGSGVFSNNSANLQLTVDIGFIPVAGDKFTIVDVPGTSAANNIGVFASLNGAAASLSQGATITLGGSLFKISYRAEGDTFDAGAGNGNNIMIETLQDTAAKLTWRGDVDGDWDVVGKLNWRNTNDVAVTFTNLDKVTFNDSGVATNINLTADLTPATILVDATKNYTFMTTTAGKLTGAIVLTKTNTGTLTLTTANDNVGAAIIHQGTVQVGAGGTDGALPCAITVNSNGVFAFNRSDSQVLGSISGKGVLWHNGSGTLSVTNDLTGFTGTVSNTAGTFQLGDGTTAGNSGKIAGTVVVASGSTLYHNYAGNADVTVANSMSGSGGATLEFSSGGARTINFATTATNTGFTGTTTVKPFTRMNVAAATAAPAGPIIVEGSAAPSFGAYYSHPGATVTNLNSITIAGEGPASPVDTPRGKGALRLGNVWAGPITLSANATIGADGTGTIIGNISDGGGSYVLEYLGGTIQVGAATGVHSYGTTKITEDYFGSFTSPTLTTVRALNANVFSSGTLTMKGRTRLELNGNNISIVNLIDTSATDTSAGTDYTPVIANGNSTTGAILTVGADNNPQLFIGTFINGASQPLGLAKVGSGTFTLSGDSTATGTVSVEAGTLALAAASGNHVNGNPVLGSGSFSNATAFAVSTGATLDVSARADGTLTLNAGQILKHGGTGTGPITVTGNVNLGSGTLLLGVNRLGFASDTLTASGTVTFSGTLGVTNLGAVLQVGDSFQLFPGGTIGFTTYSLPGIDVANNVQYTWNNTVTSDGNITVATVTPLVNLLPPNIGHSLSGNTLTLTWPTNQGWSLQAQTNGLNAGLSTNWVTVPGSSSITSTNITINPANPAVFYRLFYATP